MSEAQHTTSPRESLDSPDQVLAALHTEHQVAAQPRSASSRPPSSGRIMHPVESITHAATVEGTEGELAIAGDGAPLVAEFCIADLALALGMSTDAGRTYLGDAIELRHRLPKLWHAVTAGRVPVWKARKIAQATKTLCPDAAAHVDRHLAHVAHRCSFAQIDRAVDDALRLYDPAEADKRRREAADARHFDVDLHQVSFDGTVHVDAELDLADALDLNDAITAGAADSPSWAAKSPSTYAAPWPPEPSPAASSLSTSSPTSRTDPAQTGADDLRPPLRWHRSRRGREHPVRDQRRAGQGLVRGHQHPPHHPPGHRPQQQPAHRRLPAHRDHARAGHPDQPHLRLPPLQPTSKNQPTSTTSTSTTAPTPPATTSHRSAGATTATRPTAAGTVLRTGPTTFTWTNTYGYTYDWDTSHTRHTRHTH